MQLGLGLKNLEHSNIRKMPEVQRNMKNRTKMPSQNKPKRHSLSVDEVLAAVKHEKVSSAVTIGVQPSLLEYATRVAGNRGRSTWLRENIIENLRRKREEALERKNSKR